MMMITRTDLVSSLKTDIWDKDTTEVETSWDTINEVIERAKTYKWEVVFSNKKFALVKRGRDYVLYKVTE